MMKQLLLLTICPLIAGGLGNSVAQSSQNDDRGASVKLSLGSTYDTNRLRLDKGIAPPSGGSEDDLITSAEAKLDLSFQSGLQRIFLEGSAGYVWHRDNTFLDNEKIDLSGGIDWGLTSRCGGILSARIERKQTDLADLDAVIENTRETETFLGTAGCQIRSNVYAEVLAEHVESSNSRGSQRSDDLKSTGYGGLLEYRPNETMAVGLRFRDSEVDYVNVGTPKTEIVVIEATARRKFGNTIRIDAALGYTDAEPGSGNFTPDFAGATGHAKVDLMPSRRLTLTSQYARAIGYSSDISADFFLRDRFQLSAQAEITPIIMAEVSGRSIERDFYANGNFRVLGRTYDETKAIRGAVHYHLRKRLKLSGGIEHLERETDGLTGNYDAIRFFVSLGVTP